MERDEEVLNYEAAKQPHIDDVKRDFLGGSKSFRVHHVSKDDCR